jgi:hypothetical protein
MCYLSNNEIKYHLKKKEPYEERVRDEREEREMRVASETK